MDGNTSRTYRSWSSMKQRCRDSSSSNYHNYGGRGIEICDTWFMFELFLKDMGLRPEGTTLERKDPDGNYTPENCRWATYKQQANNMSGQKRYIVNGLEGTAPELCDILGLKYNTVWRRLNKYGWPVEKAFQTGKHQFHNRSIKKSHWE